MRIIDLLTRSAAARPKTTAIVDRDFKLSYGRMFEAVEALAARLTAAGCRSGVRVAIALGNSAEYLVSFFAISAAGGTIVGLSARMTPSEVARLVERAGVSIVITSKAYAKRLADSLDTAGSITMLLVQYETGGKLDIEAAASGPPRRIDERNCDVALMVPTSGTTGRPKIVMLTDNQLISNMAVYRLLMGFGSRNVVYCALSFHHIYCICAQILTHVSLADTFVVSDTPFFIKDFAKSVERRRLTATAFVPYMAILLADFAEPQQFDLRSLKYVTLSGARTPVSIYRTLTNKYPWVNFINTYGMSEAGSRISIASPFPSRFPPGSVGSPMPGVNVRIVDDEGTDLPFEHRGQILVKSSGVMKGYYQQADLTAQTIVDGWLRTGDLGKLDEKGNLYILGRTKDVIITGGENVCPQEIEESLIEHPGISEAAVVGQKDRLLGEVPVAFIVANSRREKLSQADIVKFCKARLSSHKIPRFIRFVRKLPKLGSSKIDRNALRRMAGNSHSLMS